MDSALVIKELKKGRKATNLPPDPNISILTREDRERRKGGKKRNTLSPWRCCGNFAEFSLRKEVTGFFLSIRLKGLSGVSSLRRDAVFDLVETYVRVEKMGNRIALSHKDFQ